VAFTPDLVKVMRRGLPWPRVNLDGDLAHGLRIWCSEDGAFAPVISKAGMWTITLNARKVRGREETVPTRPVPFTWELDDSGPVLIVPRVPDVLLPASLVDKLPNSQVDHSTIMARAEARFQREVQKAQEQHEVITAETDARIEALAARMQYLPDDTRQQVALDWQQVEAITAPQEARQEAQEGPEQPASPDSLAGALDDLRTALVMVNELKDRLGPEVVLSINDQGQVVARRKVVVVTFQDL
jgi:hypothetical protein